MENLDPQEWLTKEQAANFLGKSAKAIQRYTARGLLKVTYIKEGNLQRAYYKLDDLKEFNPQDKPSKQATQVYRSSIDTTDTVVKVDNKSVVQANLNPEKIITQLVGQVLSEAQKRGLLNLAAPIASTPSRAKEKPNVPIADKMILTISEAAALSGRPQSELRKAFLEGKLHGVKLGRGIKVRKKDLEIYVDGLFCKF
jgi:hypothetical protein